MVHSKSINFKTFFVFSLLLLSNIFLGCEAFDKEDECPPVKEYFQITGLNSTNSKFTNIEGDIWEPINQNVKVDYSSFFIRYHFEKEFISNNTFNSNGMLMALSCVEDGERGDKIGIDTLIIHTVYDYNNSHKKNSCINDIIIMNEWTSFASDFDEFYSIKQYINVNKSSIQVPHFEIKITEKPEKETEFAVKVEYILNNGDTITNISEPIILSI